MKKCNEKDLHVNRSLLLLMFYKQEVLHLNRWWDELHYSARFVRIAHVIPSPIFPNTPLRQNLNLHFPSHWIIVQAQIPHPFRTVHDHFCKLSHSFHGQIEWNDQIFRSEVLISSCAISGFVRWTRIFHTEPRHPTFFCPK